MKRNREPARVPYSSGPGRVRLFDRDFAKSSLSPDFDRDQGEVTTLPGATYTSDIETIQFKVATLPGAHCVRTLARRCVNK